MGIMAGRALYLIPFKGLYPIGKHPPPILLRDRGLIKPRVQIKGGETDGDGVVIPKILGQVTNGGIMGTADPPISSLGLVMTLSTAVAPRLTLDAHLIMGPRINVFMVFGTVQYRIDRHGTIVAGEACQGDTVRCLTNLGIKIRAGIHLVIGEFG
jgi:hypothetical protein